MAYGIIWPRSLVKPNQLAQKHQVSPSCTGTILTKPILKGGVWNQDGQPACTVEPLVATRPELPGLGPALWPPMTDT